MTANSDFCLDGHGSNGDRLSKEFGVVCLALELKKAFNEKDVVHSSEEEEKNLCIALAGLACKLRDDLCMDETGVAVFINDFFRDCIHHEVTYTNNGREWNLNISEYSNKRMSDD